MIVTYKEVFQNLAENEKSMGYITDYKKSSPNLLKEVRPEILNLNTVGEIGIYLYDNKSLFDSESNVPQKLSKSELIYLFKAIYQKAPPSNFEEEDLTLNLLLYYSNIIRTDPLARFLRWE